MNRKKEDSFQRLKSTGIWVLLMLLFVVELFFYTWCRVQCVNAGYEISKNSRNFEKLTELQINLRIEFERLRSPDRIAKIAREHIGLMNPGPEQIVIIQ
jgi:cell division protein FtsB